MFGISAGEFIVLVVVAAVVLGPERLPDYARQLARLVRELRNMAQGAGAKVREEMGPEFDEIDWRKLDPRQYDPRRIVREALSDVFDPDDPLGLNELDKPVSPGGPAEATSAARQRAAQRAAAPRSAEPEAYDSPDTATTDDAPASHDDAAAPGPAAPAIAFDPDAT